MAAADVQSRPVGLEGASEEDKGERQRQKRTGPDKQFSLNSPSHEQAGTGGATGKPVKPLKLVIFTMVKGVKVEKMFQNGRLTTTGDIMEAVLRELEMPQDYSRIFSLWLCSKHLQLQLKSYHLPCKLFKRWKELLSQYTNASYEEISKDEPILSMRRNVFYHLKEERKLRDPKKDNSKALEHLYHEAVSNVIQGRYPMNKEELHILAGLKAAIELGPYDQRPSNTLKMISNFYPKNMTGLIGKIVKNTEAQFLRFYQSASSKTTDHFQLKLLYLQLCWSKPFYGAVMFRGQIERPFNPTHYLVYQDKVVTVAINTDCLHLFEASSNPSILLYLTYDQLSWGFEPASDEGEDFFSSLWLEFDSTIEVSGEAKKVHKRVQIFSRQAPMMDAMIARCVQEIEEKEEQLKEKRKEQGGEAVLPMVVIKTSSEGASSPARRRVDRNYKEDKLVCTTYTEEGDLINDGTGFTLSRPFKHKSAKAPIKVATAPPTHPNEESPSPVGAESQPLVSIESNPEDKSGDLGSESSTVL